jgi:YVTN family beta-propeller protein
VSPARFGLLFVAVALVVLWQGHLLAAATSHVPTSHATTQPHAQAGSQAASSTMLPNGWRVSPTGSVAPLSTLPLHMVSQPSGRWLAITTGGYGPVYVSIADQQTGNVVSSVPVAGAFYGLAFSGGLMYATTANGNSIERYKVSRDTGALLADGSIKLEAPKAGNPDLWLAGLAAAGHMLYVAEMNADQVVAVDAGRGSVVWSVKVGEAPYAVVLSPDKRKVYVSNWASATVSVVDALKGRVLKEIGVGPHPNAEILSRDGKTLFVACANSDTVAEIDTQTNAVRATIGVAIYPHALAGAIPNGLALSPFGNTLFVADAGENAIAAVDLSAATPSVFGAIPTGWYPTDVAVSGEGSQLFVLDGKGVAGHASTQLVHMDVIPQGQPVDMRYYDAARATGDLEVLTLPDRAELVAGLQAARANSPYSRARSVAGQLPQDVHVIYIIKENRTYDEVLGDDPRGNGDPKLTIFGRRITPNIHSLARTFVLLDNFDCDATVSADGHNWSTAAYASDWVDKLWPAEYSERRRTYDFEERGPASPQAGYIWNDALEHGVSVRDYGEFVQLDGAPPFTPSDPTLAGHVDPEYRGFDLKHSDQERLDAWLREFRRYVSGRDLPRLEIVRLPDDHTAATRPGYKTPYAMVADNDYALGRLVDAVSHSPYWKNTIIFSVEDDAQAGPDHVSDHRAEALIAGGLVRRGVVDHTHYTTSGVLRTIELLLGLPPMSQFDRAATPLLSDILTTPDTRPWTVLPPQVSLEATNPAGTADARTSSKLDFSDADEADPATLTAILYRFAATHKP